MTLREKFFSYKRQFLDNEPQDLRVASEMAPIRIKEVLKTLKKTKKVFRISFMGGEPFLIPNIVEACVAFSQNHYLSFNSNLILPSIEKFAAQVDPSRVLFILASLHLEELERMHLRERFIHNYHLIKKTGIPIHATEVAYPPLLSKIAYFRSLYKKSGIEFELEPYRGWYRGKEYPAAYSQSEMKFFQVDNIIPEFYQWFHKECIAGYAAGEVLPNGDIISCSEYREKCGNIYSKIEFKKKPKLCNKKYCICPLSSFDPFLHKKIYSK